MAFTDRLSTDRQPRQPGQPVPSQVSNAPPRPSMPNSFINPPAPAVAPVGRPPTAQNPPFAGGAGLPLPTSPVSPPTRPSMPVTKPTPAPGARDDWEPRIAPQQVPPVVSPQPVVFQMDKVPSRAELVGMPPGTQIQTPYGTVDHTGKLSLSPEGTAKYQQAVVQRRKDYGPHPWAGDPQAPQPKIELGKPLFNPFTGRWS